MEENYLLEGSSAIRIYREIASLPIFDYHSHLVAREIYEDRAYANMAELWLANDHYKWRLMRIAGVAERYITGSGEPMEKWRQFASILPSFVGNPVYEWAHMELGRYFGIHCMLSSESQDMVWRETESMMRERKYSPRSLLAMANVRVLMTTDDPTDSLEYHALLKDEGYVVDVIPTFRADRVIDIARCDFAQYVHALATVAGMDIYDIDSLVDALRARLDYFVANGSNIADISLPNMPRIGREPLARETFDRAMQKEKISRDGIEAYMAYMLARFAGMVAERDMVLQLHIGALRNANTSLYTSLGRDAGGDSIGDEVDIVALAEWLDALDMEGKLPSTIVYTHNANSYYPLATLLASFCRGESRRVALGTAWWMNDHREGILRQLEVVKNTTGLGNMLGMLTDSRSYTAFVRHDYFRRILASYLAKISGGSVNDNIVGIARDIAYYNAERSLGKGERI